MGRKKPSQTHGAGRLDRLRSRPHRGPKHTQEDAGGRINKSNNHSKLTDSNNCLRFLFLAALLLLSRLPSSLRLLESASCALSVLRDRADVNCVRDRCASSLRNKEFFTLQPRPNITCNRSRTPTITPFDPPNGDFDLKVRLSLLSVG